MSATRSVVSRPSPVVEPEPSERGLRSRSLGTFFALAFGLGWGTMAAMAVFIDQIEAVFGEIGYTNPVFILAVWSPGIAGVWLVWRHHGAAGVRSFLRRLTLWRMPVAWWAFLVVGVPAIVYLGAAIKGTIGDPFPFSPWYDVLPMLGFALIIGPVEELGWRGVALPLLQRRFAPLWAGLLLGVMWGLWHAPAFLFSGTPQSAWSFGPYVLGILALSVIWTPMFNASGGSILIAALFHWQINGPAWPDAQPWDYVVYGVVAVLIVVLNRRRMFTREGAVTDVLLPPADETAADTDAVVSSGRPTASR